MATLSIPDTMPAVFELGAGEAPPEWLAVSCVVCGRRFALDWARADEAKLALLAAGHGVAHGGG